MTRELVRYTLHAGKQLLARGIAETDVITVLACPEYDEADLEHPGARRAFGRAASIGNRILRVVYRKDGSQFVVITVYPDRNFLRRQR
jgi:Domain of unknown function (DUF4258)